MKTINNLMCEIHHLKKKNKEKHIKSETTTIANGLKKSMK